MVSFTRTPAEVVAQRYRVRARERIRLHQEEAKVVNSRAVLELVEGRSIEFRGRRYQARPVGYLEGIRLQELMTRLQRVREPVPGLEARAELVAFFEDGISLCAALMRPCGWRRFPWLLGVGRRRPFEQATEADLIALLAGFWLCRTKLTVRPASRH